MSSANTMTIQLSGGREVCLSYGIPVAAFIPGRGYLKTARRYSATSSKHANQYAAGRRDVTTLDDATFRALVPELTQESGR